MLEGVQIDENYFRTSSFDGKSKGKTLLLQASTSDSHTRVPTQINWNDVKLLNRWLLRNVTQPTLLQSTLEDDLDYID